MKIFKERRTVIKVLKERRITDRTVLSDYKRLLQTTGCHYIFHLQNFTSCNKSAKKKTNVNVSQVNFETTCDKLDENIILVTRLP